MKKTISIYTPQEKMPEPDTQVLIGSHLNGVAIAHYLGDDNWEVAGYAYGTLRYITKGIEWWLDLENLSSKVELSLMKASWKKNHPDSIITTLE